MLSVFHNRRWDSDFLTVRDILPRLGEVMLFEAHWDRFRPQIKPGWREQPEPGGGVFSDLGPHLIDQALQLFGMPEAVSADIAAQRPGAAVDDYFDLTLHYGATARVPALLDPDRGAATALRGPRNAGIVRQERPRSAGGAAQGRPRPARRSRSASIRSTGLFVRPTDVRSRCRTKRGNYLHSTRRVAAAILDGAPPPVPAQEARDGLALINLARRAAAVGRRCRSRAPVRGETSAPEA